MDEKGDASASVDSGQPATWCVAGLYSHDQWTHQAALSSWHSRRGQDIRPQGGVACGVGSTASTGPVLAVALLRPRQQDIDK